MKSGGVLQGSALFPRNPLSKRVLSSNDVVRGYFGVRRRASGLGIASASEGVLGHDPFYYELVFNVRDCGAGGLLLQVRVFSRNKTLILRGLNE